MFEFKYSVEVDLTEIKSVKLTCDIEYIDPLFEERINKILNEMDLILYLSDVNSNWLSKIFKDEVTMALYIGRCRSRDDKVITDDFIEKKVLLQFSYIQNIERVKQLFEKKVREVFQNEIRYFEQLKKTMNEVK